jgi:deoxyribodipyrimidine photo-lyase
MNPSRVRTLKEDSAGQGPVILWMSRDQRVNDNWALIYAQDIARERKVPLAVVFCLVPQLLGATMRQYGFMLKGLQAVEASLAKKNIPFSLLTGAPEEAIPLFIEKNKAGTLVKDFDPLRIKQQWTDEVLKKIAIPLFEVDAHNIIPCWIASPKQEFAAYTIRPKIKRALPEFLDEFPKLKKHPVAWQGKMPKNDWNSIQKTLKVDSVPVVDWINPGEKQALRMLRTFLEKKLHSYTAKRNDPAEDGQSNLSPYLHFGQISAQRVALDAENASVDKASRDAFLEELIVRRELSDNFCFYNKEYDNFHGFPAWAQKTLNGHRRDRRIFLYAPEQFEHAQTHDELWNAAQKEMVKRGKMHGYMRMYWAKKILEWTESPEKAMEIAIYLNDRYEIDGRDPNGYTGIAWSIGGVHDRAWNERPIFGKIRYMSYNGCRSKFDVKKYIEFVKSL